MVIPIPIVKRCACLAIQLAGRARDEREDLKPKRLRHCSRCGYDLSGQICSNDRTSERCPECGHSQHPRFHDLAIRLNGQRVSALRPKQLAAICALALSPKRFHSAVEVDETLSRVRVALAAPLVLVYSAVAVFAIGASASLAVWLFALMVPPASTSLASYPRVWKNYGNYSFKISSAVIYPTDEPESLSDYFRQIMFGPSKEAARNASVFEPQISAAEDLLIWALGWGIVVGLIVAVSVGPGIFARWIRGRHDFPWRRPAQQYAGNYTLANRYLLFFAMVPAIFVSLTWSVLKIAHIAVYTTAFLSLQVPQGIVANSLERAGNFFWMGSAFLLLISLLLLVLFVTPFHIIECERTDDRSRKSVPSRSS